MRSATVSLLVFIGYSLSIVTTPLSVTAWMQFAMQILTGFPTPKSRLPMETGDYGNICHNRQAAFSFSAMLPNNNNNNNNNNN